MFKNIFIAAGVMASCALFSAEKVVFEVKSKADLLPGWSTRNRVKMTPDNKIHLTKGWCDIASKFFSVDLKAKYKVTGDFRLIGESAGKTTLYVGLTPFTDKGAIGSTAVMPVPGTETVLADSVDKGDTTIDIKAPAKAWPANGHIAFNVKKDLSDIPNLSCVSYKKAQKDGDIITLTLHRKMKTSYPADCPVRFHKSGAGYMYTAAVNAAVTPEWKTFSGTVQGEINRGTPGNKWWKGTTRAVLKITKYGDGVVEVRNFKIVKID